MFLEELQMAKKNCEDSYWDLDFISVLYQLVLVLRSLKE